MARIRSIKPDFFTSETIARLPVSARLTFVGLWTHVDDNGVCRANELLIAAALYPLDGVEGIERTREDLRRLSGESLVTLYEHDAKRFLWVTSWDEHQKVSHPGKSRYPRPDQTACKLVSWENEPIPEPRWKFSGESPETLRPEQGAGSREQGVEQGSKPSSSDAASQTSDGDDDLTEDDDEPFPAKYLPFVAEIDALCCHLADKIHERRRLAGSKTPRPNITQRWRVAAGRLLVLDGLSAKQVEAAIDWSQQDEFWAPNIESMPSLRKQFEKLRAAAKQRPAGHALVGVNGRPRSSTPSVGRTHQQ
jgi:hypothetical protein